VTTARLAAAEGDLTACDREPIHLLGRTQRRGVLVASRHGVVTHVSANATDLLAGRNAEALLGTSLASLLGPSLARSVEDALATRADGGSPFRLFATRLKGRSARVNVAAHRHGGLTLVELESADATARLAPLDLVRSVLGRLQSARALRELCDETASELRSLLAMDRVMIYRFLEDGSGQVIAEARSPVLPPLLDLRYPASDIPAQARELYRKNWVRLIDDVASVPVALVTRETDPLDLSFADLRAVSPTHIEYLRNMRVGASLSISIVVDGELWGLIACHHTTPRHVGANIRVAVELVGQVFSLQIQTVQSVEEYVTMRAGRHLLDRVITEFPIEGNLVDALAGRLEQLAAFIPCDGIAVLVEGQYRTSGVAPTAEETQALADVIDREGGSVIFATHKIAEVLPEASTWTNGTCGALAVPLSRASGNWLFYFRRAIAQVIEWAGDPNKRVILEEPDGRISPRKSFDKWRIEVRGQSLPWSTRDRLLGDTLRVYLLDILVRFTEVIHEERRQAEQRRRIFITELNHRVRGTLELIQSLVIHGYEGPAPVRDFVRALEGRMKAIALAHEATSVTDGAELQTLIERALALRAPTARQTLIEGPPVRLDPRAYTVLALVIHELATATAGERGALADSSGRLSVTWFLDAEGRIVLTWDGRGGSNPRFPDELGGALIRRNVPHALGGEAEYRAYDGNVKASFVIPARFVVEERAPRPPEGTGHAHRDLSRAPARPLDGYAVLVVEDQMLAAVELERLFLERGAASVRVAGTAAGALAALRESPPDVALLDLDLGEGTSVAVADALAASSIPFLFACGPLDRSLLPAQYAEAPIVRKPYELELVVEELRSAMVTRLIRAVLTQLT